MSVLAATSNIWVLGGFFAACVLLFIVPGVLFAKFVVDACVRDKHYDAAVGARRQARRAAGALAQVEQ
jgi:hypothetical protein